MKIKIGTSKDEAKKQHDEIQEYVSHGMTIYIDGSGIEKKISAATYNSTSNRTSYQYLESEMQYNVFADELTALCLSVNITHSTYTWTVRPP